MGNDTLLLLKPHSYNTYYLFNFDICTWQHDNILSTKNVIPFTAIKIIN